MTSTPCTVVSGRDQASSSRGKMVDFGAKQNASRVNVQADSDNALLHVASAIFLSITHDK